MNGKAQKQGSDSSKPFKRRRKVITLEQKLEVLKMYEKKIRTRDIVRLTGLNEATLRCIRGNAESIKKSYADSTPLGVKRTTKRRPEIMQMMEKQLVSWINEEVEKNSCVTLLAIKSKALSIFENLKKDYSAEADKLTFTASSGWFNRFKLREQIQNINVCGDYSTLDSFCSQINSDCDEQDNFLFLNQNLDQSSFSSSPQNSPLGNDISKSTYIIQEHIEIHPEIYESEDQMDKVDDSLNNTLTKDILLKNLGHIEDALRELQRYDNCIKRSSSVSEEIKIVLKPYYDLLQQELHDKNQTAEEAELSNSVPCASHEDSNLTDEMQQTLSELDDASDSDSKEMILPI